jgi:hypothetical protein
MNRIIGKLQEVIQCFLLFSKTYHQQEESDIKEARSCRLGHNNLTR